LFSGQPYRAGEHIDVGIGGNMILFAAAGILFGGYAACYAVYCIKRKKAPQGMGAILLAIFCFGAAGLITLC